MKSGKGKYFFDTGEIYEGEFANDSFEGIGKYTYNNGNYYVGTFSKSLKHGKGKQFYKDGNLQYDIDFNHGKLEITEETELVTTEETGELIKQIRAFGYTFALDDFSMGHTSLQYLQHNQFDIVKLDGNLVKSLLSNERTREIINSIVYLSLKPLNRRRHLNR